MCCLFKDVDWLVNNKNDGYGIWPIPYPLDDEIIQLIESTFRNSSS
jgi:hypothetical protein